MIMKSNLSKMLGRMAPPQADGAAATPSDMIMRLRQMMGGQQMGSRGVTDNRIDSGNFGRPMQPPMAYPGGNPNFNESTGLYTPDGQGLSGFMSRFGKLLNKGPGRGIGYRAFDEGVGGGVMTQPSPPAQPYVDSRGNTHYPDGTVAADAPGTVPPWAIPPLPQPAGGLTQVSDPDFNINTATNTFFKALGDRVASGQMTLDQARAAQAEMRALQLNPAAANRAAATEIAQRNLQVGPYAPRPAQGLGAIMQGVKMAEAPQYMPPPVPKRSDMPAPQGMTLTNVPRQLTLSNVPQQGVAPQPMSAPQGMAMGGLLRKYYGGGMC